MERKNCRQKKNMLWILLTGIQCVIKPKMSRFAFLMKTIHDARSSTPRCLLIAWKRFDTKRAVQTREPHHTHTQREWEGKMCVCVCVWLRKWIGVWLYAMYLISFYYYCYYNIMFIVRRCYLWRRSRYRRCCRRPPLLYTSRSESSI